MPKGVYKRPHRTCEIPECARKHLAKGMCSLHYHRERSGYVPLDLDEGGMRSCTICGETKKLDQFRISPRNRDGRGRNCKQCDQAMNARWMKHPDNAERMRLRTARNKALRTYGPDGAAAWDRIQAGDSCDACGERRPQMHIDHRHSNGEVRDILCSQCNTALGLLAESPDRFTALMVYLFTHESQYEAVENAT